MLETPTFKTNAPSITEIPSRSNDQNYLCNLSIQKRIGAAKFSVYLAEDSSDGKQYALKAYPHTNNGLHLSYINESRFCKLSHPHICKIVGAFPEHEVIEDSNVKKYSFILLEYAPYGDFFQFFAQKKALLSEKLARTYFHQLIEGLEYLHGRGIAHLDIKSENLLIGDDFKLKIADFDMSQYRRDAKLETNGTLCYRAPEVIDGSCTDFVKADTYSAGIMLFIFRSGGVPPHLEQTDYQDINLYQLLLEDKEEFWAIHASYQDTENFYSKSFKNLFEMMTEKDPAKRATLSKIKESEWYNGPVLSPQQVKTEMNYFYLI